MKTLGLLAGMAVSLVLPVAAQDFPSKPIRIIAPFGPGTATDTVARVVAAEIGKLTGQSVVIENKPGAEGQIGAQAAAAAAPDGYTMFITTQTTQAINQHVYKTLAYDPVKSFTPVSGLTLGAQIVMVKNELPVKTVAELIALARKEPGKLSFGSGNGSAAAAPSCFASWQKSTCWACPTNPNRRPSAIFWAAVLTSSSPTSRPACRWCSTAARAGLAVTSKKSIPGLDQFPPVDETVPGFEMWAWTAAYVPAGTPRPIVEKLNELVRAALKSEFVPTLTRTTYGVPFPGTPEELRRLPGERRRRSGARSSRSRGCRALARLSAKNAMR